MNYLFSLGKLIIFGIIWLGERYQARKARKRAEKGDILG